MRRKILFIFTVLTFLLNISNQPSFAGPFADEMAKCLVTSTSSRDRNKLLKWMFKIYSDHPEVSYMVDLSDREKKVIDKDVADLFTRLLSEDCLDESKKAQKYEGNTVFSNSFQILGQVASQGFMGNPDVQRSMKKVYELMDYEKLNYLGN
tara:strand:+ start:74 stop:526 length:453 start_codon:yes stop_codon:yes gene_type:complete